MYIKWIVCQVNPNHIDSFSKAQEAWFELKTKKGFIAQTGGWNEINKNEACIIAFWENKDCLNYFMKEFHDKITEKNNQLITYEDIVIDYQNKLLNIEGEQKTLTGAVINSKLIRIADCRIKESNKSHFIEAQKKIWNPGMKKASGMLGGTFSLSDKEENKYLVISFWNSKEQHKNYTENLFPIYKKESKAEEDLININGKRIIVEEKWKIIKK